MLTPPWLALRTEIAGRDALVAGILERLVAPGAVAVCGEPGVGVTSVLAVVAARSERAVVAASLAGCDDADDAVRALGEALGVRPVGDMGAVIEALADRVEGLLIVDEVGGETVWDAILQLAETAGDVRVCGAARVADAVEVPALPEGNLAVLRLAAALSMPPERAIERVAARAGWLAAFPMGIPASLDEAPAAALVPDRLERVILRAGIAARLGRPDPVDAVARAVERLAPRLQLAEGAAMGDVADQRDLLALRRVAALTPDASLRCKALASAARLALVAGQVEVARALARDAMRGAAAPRDRGTALWADADALLYAGEVDEAVVRYGEAAEWMRRGHDAFQNATILRRAGDRLAARGHVIAAERQYRQARWYYRSERAPIGVAAALRGAAALAVQAGEFVSAGTLHEQVAAAVEGDADGVKERANLRLGEATLSLSRGELGRADRLLRALGDAAGDDLLLRANVMRRRADLLLRRGEHDAARTAAEQAGALFATLGEVCAQAACVRLAGDVGAAAGKLGAALAAYRTATRLQVRVQDLRGLMRTLEHAAVVAEATGDLDEGRRLREQRAAVIGALGEA